MDIYQLYQNENEYEDLNADRAVSHLSQMIQINTTSYMDTSKISYAAFDELHRKLHEWYPEIMRQGEYQELDYSVLIRIEGSDPSLKPALFMAHQDVVPVVEGTEQDWIHGPFSGDVADGYIWGRGAYDIKEMLAAELESMEYLLEHGKKFRRTVYLAFGQDEETVGTGAIRIARYLKEQNIELEYVLDEGGRIGSGEAYDADIAVGSIGMYEKGYADMKLSAESRGGHSSNPFRGTSLGVLAKAITAVVDHPLENVLPECAKETLRILEPYMHEGPLKEAVRNRDEQEMIRIYLAHPDLNSQVHTTIAPTMISGGSQAGNVMPQHMEAVINFRLAPQDTDASVLEHCRRLIGSDVHAEYIVANEASRQSRFDTEGFRSLQQVLSHFFKDIVFVPSVNTTATDARSYEEVCDCCMRFEPFFEQPEIRAEGVHGTNERMSVRAYLQGIRVLIRMMDQTC
ncbi:MAG: M20/M25/M40 family metallo-hydrolase [Solobacterium sp.]|nr:M20/M25/M40 family metallo-hydrolase [Solobacterium sp.]